MLKKVFTENLKLKAHLTDSVQLWNYTRQQFCTHGESKPTPYSLKAVSKDIPMVVNFSQKTKAKNPTKKITKQQQQQQLGSF